MRFESYISLRYFFSPRTEGAVSFITWVAVLGVTLGVGALVVAMAVMNGYQTNLVRTMAGALPHLTLHPLVRDGVPPLEEIPELLGPEARPLSIAPLRLQETLLRGPETSGGLVQGVMIRGIDPVADSNVPSFLAFLNDGSPDWNELPAEERLERARLVLLRLESQEREGVFPVLISSLLAGRLGVEKGGILRPLSFPGKGGGFSPQPLESSLQVVGFFNSGIVALDELVAFANQAHVADMFPASARASSVGVRLEDPLQASLITRKIRSEESDESRLYYVYSWLESNKGLFQVILVQKTMLFLVLMMIVLIAFFGMVSALV
ncbi:MAG: ABC transporter permease, partial [Deltaproteobacteria bacterium]|nr:ABC transporter permease [Deltaproteobacteria bacterium]